jgi:FKBP-type peptidyl-prolyl cis-trans isomerase 2|tara:strand:+ start:1131 stop:1373 length:243 start_codon:yes stop_codon:yes gene_type:complete
MITIKDLNELSITQLQDTKVLIDTLVQNKIKREFKVGTQVNVVQKTKKTLGVITKIMSTKCLVDLNGRIYRVSMSMLEAA